MTKNWKEGRLERDRKKKLCANIKSEKNRKRAEEKIKNGNAIRI